MDLKENELKDLNNIGGWLAFFIFSLIAVSPIFNTFLLVEEIVDFLTLIDVLGGISLFMLSGIFLWKRKPYAIKFTKIFLIVIFIFNIVYFLLGITESNTIGSGFIYFIIWILFLYKSKRVKAIYGNLKEKQEGYQIWPIVAIIYSLLMQYHFGIVFGVVAIINILKNKKLKGMGLSLSAIAISVIVIIYFLFF